MPKHYRTARMDLELISRSKAVKLLRVSLSKFKHLCLRKGFYPLEPKNRIEGDRKTYYSKEYILFLQQDPLVELLRYEDKFKIGLEGFTYPSSSSSNKKLPTPADVAAKDARRARMEYIYAVRRTVYHLENRPTELVIKRKPKAKAKTKAKAKANKTT